MMALTRLALERELRASDMNEEVKGLLSDIAALKSRGADRVKRSSARLGTIAANFNARMDEAETKLAAHFDNQAMAVESAVREMITAGEQISNASGADGAEATNEPPPTAVPQAETAHQSAPPMPPHYAAAPRR